MQILGVGSILLVLAAVLLPAVTRGPAVRGTAQRVQCKNNLRQIRLALERRIPRTTSSVYDRRKRTKVAQLANPGSAVHGTRSTLQADRSIETVERSGQLRSVVKDARSVPVPQWESPGW